MLLISGPHTYNLSWGTLLQIYVSIYRCSIGNFMLCIATLLQMHMCIYVWLTCVVFISYRLGHSNRSIDVRLPNGSMSAPSKVVSMGPLSRSTINHLVYRELQLSICAVSQPEYWPHAPLRAWASSTQTGASMCDSPMGQCQLLQGGVDGAALREHHQPPCAQRAPA